MPIDWGVGLGLGLSGLFGLLGSKDQASAIRDASTPLPTYIGPYSTPEMQTGYGVTMPYLQDIMGGNIPAPTYQPTVDVAQTGTMPTWGGVSVPTSPTWSGFNMPTTPQWQDFVTPSAPSWSGFNVPSAPAPTGDWYSNLDPTVRAGIEQPYMRGMEMLEEQLSGRGQLGGTRGGISGSAANVLGEYMAEAGPRMAETAWGMMAPGLLTQQQQQYQQALLGAERPWEAGTTGRAMDFERMMQLANMGFTGGLNTQGLEFQRNLMGATMPWDIAKTAMEMGFQSNILGAQMPFQAGMNLMNQQYGANIQQAGVLGDLQRMFADQTWQGQMLPAQMMSLLPQFMPNIFTGTAGVYGPEGMIAGPQLPEGWSPLPGGGGVMPGYGNTPGSGNTPMLWDPQAGFVNFGELIQDEMNSQLTPLTYPQDPMRTMQPINPVPTNPVPTSTISPYNTYGQLIDPLASLVNFGELM